jgi:signal transduction histidine kinase/CheY-like chemotaxis protein/HPt (histidine-containing phosphotransfer) domain-containing protein
MSAGDSSAKNAELQAANEALRRSRVAALNLMQDALAARRKAEESEQALARAARQRALLVELSARVVAQRSVDELLATVVNAARELTEARLSVSGHGYAGDEFRVGMASRAEGLAACPPGEVFKIEKGGVYLEVLHGGPSLRLREGELPGHPASRGLPEGHAPLRGLLGARLVNTRGEPCGLIMVSDKEGGGDFTEEDEAHLRQLASVTSLALGHIEARTAAEAANESKSRFLANISHELRTPMNAILGMVDLALAKQVDPTATDFLRTARGSADLLLALLNDLLDSAKIEAGKLELESAPFSLRRVLDQTTQVLAVRASEKGISFSCCIPPEVPNALVGDQVRLRQILLNLAGNAIKFTESGEVTVSVEQFQIADLKSEISDPESEICHLRFAVRDTGIGISPSELGRIFQPFSQADPSTTRRFGGTGLGLTICSSLVRLMGGRIWAESEVGKGSTFHFTVRLPLAKGLRPEPATTPEISAVAASTLRILLVEDNPANQKLAAYILEDRGHTVAIAADGRQAIRMAQENRYDVILMDVQMPGMDGLEATAAIRKRETEKGSGMSDRNDRRDWGLEGDKPATSDPQHPIPNPQSPIPSPRVPIIAMTAHAMKGDRQRCLAAGMDAYLSKPIDGHEMIALVERLAAEGLEQGLGIRDWGLEKSKHPTTPGSESLIPNPQSLIPSPPNPQSPIPSVPQSLIPSSPSPGFDPELALKRCFNKPEMVGDLIRYLFSEADSLFPQMRAALEKGDLREVGRLGHRLKGTVVYLGAASTSEAALRVERFEWHGGEQSEAEEAVNALEHECEVLKAVLTEHRLAAAPQAD